METLPLYISIVFLTATVLTGWFLYKAGTNAKILLFFMLIWLLGQSLLALSRFYTVTNSFPPRLLCLLLPPLFLIIILFTTAQGRTFINRFDIRLLTLLHLVRVPVELVLYWLALNKVVPELMTFEGRNFDILAGLSAPFVYYFGFVKKSLPFKAVLIWNFMGLGLLLNIVINGILSVPTPFQKFAFDQPNIALLYFPFVLLPGFIVPAVFFAHLVSIRQLYRQIRHKTINATVSKATVI